MQALLCPVVVGHDAERAALAEALDAAAGGAGGMVVVAGEAGVGKSRLLRELATIAASGGTAVLTGRCLHRRSMLPLRPVTEAVQPLAERPELLEDVRLGAFGIAAARLVRAAGVAAAQPGEALVAGEALIRLLALVGERRGCLLVLEDLHWADPTTLEVLSYCADHLHATRVLCLTSVRTGEGGDAEREMRLLAERRATRLLELSRLDPAMTDRMLSACLSDDRIPDELRRFVRDRSEGVPLFVEELLAGLAASDALHHTDDGWTVASRLVPRIPLTHAEAVSRRLDALGGPGRAVVEAAALLGRSFDAGLLPAATGLTPARVAATLAAATDAQLLGHSDSGFSFRHALSRDVVLSELVPPLRAERAAAVLAAVEAAHPALPGDWAAVAIDLAEQAGDRRRAAKMLLIQARRALTAGSVATAVGQLARARGLAVDDPALGVAVDETEASAAALAGDVEGAARLATRALPALAGEPDGVRRQARLLGALCRAAVAAGRWAEAWEHLTAMQERLAEIGDAPGNADALALEAQVAIGVGEEDRAARQAEAAVALLASGAAPAAGCEAFEVLGRLVRPRDVDAARRHFQACLRLATAHELALWRARALHELGTIDLYTTQDDRNLLAAREAAVEAGAAGTLALVDMHLASVALAQWEPHRGLEPAERCVELSRRLRLSTLGMGLQHLAVVHAQLGNEAAMRQAVADAAAAEPDDVDVQAGVRGRGHLHAAVRRGAFQEALAHLDAAMEVLRAAPTPRAFPFRGVWALLHEVHGEAATVRAEARAHADSGVPFNATALALADAVALGREGRGEEAAATAVGILHRWRQGSSMAVWTSVLLRLVAEAAVEDGWGTPEQWLGEACATFDATGYGDLASSCRAVLRRAGAPVPRRGRGSAVVPPSLRALGVTSRETDVLLLLAEGATNREIADRLHLSVRTIDRHVANLLTKTSTADRRALARLTAGALSDRPGDALGRPVR